MIDVRDHGAVCDGVADDRGGVQAALDRAADVGGDVVLPKGRCRILTTRRHPSLNLAPGTTLRGAGPRRTSMYLETDDRNGYRELLRTHGSGVTVAQMSLQRSGNVYGVMVNLGNGSGLTLRDVNIVGDRWANPSTSFHGITNAGSGIVDDVLLERIAVFGCDYGLLQNNAATTSMTGWTVRDSEFMFNAADDLGFNVPSGSMTGVLVENSRFTSGRGFGVSLANVQDVQLVGNTFHGYVREFVHIEDRSRNVELRQNVFTGNRRNATDFYSFVFVINGSDDVRIIDNSFRTSPAENPFRCVFVGPGSPTAPAPQGVVIQGNDARLRPNCTLLEEYGGSGVTVSP